LAGAADDELPDDGDPPLRLTSRDGRPARRRCRLRGGLPPDDADRAVARRAPDPVVSPLQDTQAVFRGQVTEEELNSEVELLNYENATNTRVQIYRNQVGGDATLSPVLSFRGNIGAFLFASVQSNTRSIPASYFAR